MNHKIMEKPLPTILDELEQGLIELSRLIKEGQKAIGEAQKATEEARVAGEKAVGEAARVAGERITAAEDRLAGELAAIRKVAEEGVKLSREALAFAHLIDAADASALNAASKARNDKMAEWK